MIGYTCKYTPIELLAGFGADCVLLNEEAESFAFAEENTHANMCCHTKALMQLCENGKFSELVLVNCCDSVRRAYDVLKQSGKLKFVYFLDLPHTDNDCARERFAGELKKLACAYSEYSGREFNKNLFFKAFKKSKPLPDTDFLAVMGARVGNGLFKTIQQSLSLPIANETCSENRNVQTEIKESLSFDEIIDDYAAALLSQLPCMRMGDISARKQLLLSPNLKGIIYHTVKFCDYYSFEYDSLKSETALPILKFETDFTPQSSGQLSTRLEAFSESLIKKENVKSFSSSGKLAVGIDSGSTSTDVVILDENKKIIAHSVVRTGAKAELGAEKALNDAMAKAKCTLNDIGYTISTGYGRENITADESVTEITCHARGAYYLHPQTKTIIDIGGQDSKVIILNDDGTVKSFTMNDKCAAGTGRFLELMARTLELSMDEMSDKGLRWSKNLTISSMCTVFAESEVVSLIAKNHRTSDIIHGLNCSVANRTASMAARAGGAPEYQMTGGVALNKGVVNALEEKLGACLWISETPEICGALGAALFAAERLKNNKS